MKHIGIVNITTIGACICANEIVSRAASEDSTGNHPEFTMHAFPFIEYKKLVLSQDWTAIAVKIVDSIKKLQHSGAEFIIIPSNTPHYGIRLIQERSPLPVLNLIELTANECQKKGFRRVAVLGTKFTMQGGLYDNYLKERGITPVIPDERCCEKIHQLIMDEIIPSKINSRSVEEVRALIQSLECDAVILGCTELPEVFNSTNIGKPAIDTTRLLAHEALAIAMKPSLENILPSFEIRGVE